MDSSDSVRHETGQSPAQGAVSPIPTGRQKVLWKLSQSLDASVSHFSLARSYFLRIITPQKALSEMEAEHKNDCLYPDGADKPLREGWEININGRPTREKTPRSRKNVRATNHLYLALFPKLTDWQCLQSSAASRTTRTSSTGWTASDRVSFPEVRIVFLSFPLRVLVKPD